MQHYNANTEHKPFDKSESKGHPRPRIGATAKKRVKQERKL
jgi:hypothetical protein